MRIRSDGGGRLRFLSRVVLGWFAIIIVAVSVPTFLYYRDARSVDQSDRLSELAVAREVGFLDSEVEWSDTVVDQSPRDALKERNVVVSSSRYEAVLREYGARSFCRLKIFGENFPKWVSRPDVTDYYLYVKPTGGQQKIVTVIVVGVRREGVAVFITERPKYTAKRNSCL